MTSLKFYRWVVFILAAGYMIDNLLRWGTEIFHYLTNWGLTGALICSALLLYETLSGRKLAINSILIATFCLSAVVMILYWKLYWTDPSLLYADKAHMPWYRDDYVHLVGPLLQMFDALCLRQAFCGRLLRGLCYYLIIATSYAFCSEYLFSLPYPFMWSLDFMQRLSFYANGVVLGVIAFFVGVALNQALLYFGVMRQPSLLNKPAKM